MPIPEAVTGGVRRYTIPASNAFGLPYPYGYGNPPAACQGNAPETPWEKWRIVMKVLIFIIGLMIGGMFGVVIMCLLQASRLHEWKEENDVFGNQQKR